MIVIGVTGFRRSGKNSTTSILSRYGFNQYGFADALRIMASAVDPVISLQGASPMAVDVLRKNDNGVQLEYRYSQVIGILSYERAKDEVPDIRRYLQKLGTDGVRSVFGSRAWVDALARRLAVEQPARVAISDVRFRSEAEWVLSLPGAQLWRVTRPGYGGDDPHPSETEIPNLPATRDIVATTLDELEREVIQALNETLPQQDRDHEPTPAGPASTTDNETRTDGPHPTTLSADSAGSVAAGSLTRQEDRAPR